MPPHSHFTDLSYPVPKQLNFNISNVDLSIVNALRRIILSEIPSPAFYFDANDVYNKDITISKNTSPIHNEFFAQRISMVPLFLTPEETAAVNAGTKKYVFSISKKNTQNSTIPVTTEDFTCTLNGEPLAESEVRRIFPADPITKDYILLNELKPNIHNTESGNEVELTAIPTVGIPKKNTCYCSASLCTYGNAIDKQKSEAAFQNMLKEKAKSGIKYDEETMRKEFKTLDIQRYFVTNDFDEPSKFEFKIESENGFDPDYLFETAFEILEEKFARVLREITNNDDIPDSEKNVIVTSDDRAPDMFKISVIGETHTLGNVFQSMFYNYFVRNETKLHYIGYSCPHPLKDVCDIKVKLYDPKDMAGHESVDKNRKALIDVIVAGVKHIKSDVSKLRAEWKSAIASMSKK